MDVLKRRRAPRIRNMLTSAVALSTAVGVFETFILRRVQVWTST